MNDMLVRQAKMNVVNAERNNAGFVEFFQQLSYEIGEMLPDIGVQLDFDLVQGRFIMYIYNVHFGGKFLLCKPETGHRFDCNPAAPRLYTAEVSINDARIQALVQQRRCLAWANEMLLFVHCAWRTCDGLPSVRQNQLIGEIYNRSGNCMVRQDNMMEYIHGFRYKFTHQCHYTLLPTLY